MSRFTGLFLCVCVCVILWELLFMIDCIVFPPFSPAHSTRCLDWLVFFCVCTCVCVCVCVISSDLLYTRLYRLSFPLFPPRKIGLLVFFSVCTCVCVSHLMGRTYTIDCMIFDFHPLLVNQISSFTSLFPLCEYVCVCVCVI